MTHVIGRTEHLSPIPDGAIRTLWHGRIDLQAIEVDGKEVLLWKGEKIELPRHTGHSPRSFVNMSWFWTIPRTKSILASYTM